MRPRTRARILVANAAEDLFLSIRGWLEAAEVGIYAEWVRQLDGVVPPEIDPDLLLIAESDDTVVVEGNHYFPRATVDATVLEDSETTSHCGWKGTARYHHVSADGKTARELSASTRSTRLNLVWRMAIRFA